MSNFSSWARKELEMLNKDNDPYQRIVTGNILELVDIFEDQGHKGFSASYVLDAFYRLEQWKPLTPLTGEESEWGTDAGYDQNNRFAEVFRYDNDNSTAYWINGKIFSSDGGLTWFTNRESCVPITFPFTVPSEPEKVYIEYKDETKRAYKNITNDPERIKALREKKLKKMEEEK